MRLFEVCFGLVDVMSGCVLLVVVVVSDGGFGGLVVVRFWGC